MPPFFYYLFVVTLLFSQVKNEFYGHHAKPVTLAWSPDNEHFATGGMDMMVFIWTVGDPDKRIKLPGRPHKCTCTFTQRGLQMYCKGTKKN